MRQENWDRKRDVMHYYDRLANTYDILYRDEQLHKIDSTLANIQMKDSDLILDVGCGTGLLFERIKRSTRLLVGVDISLNLLKIAVRRAKSLQLRKEHVFLIRADVDYLPFHGDTFDKTFAFTLLQNIPEWNTALREIVRVTKYGSSIVVTGLRKSFTEEKLSTILRKMGLERLAIEGINHTQDIITICYKSL